MDSSTYTIAVRAEGTGAPAIIRLRRALKWLLRDHGLRCVAVSELLIHQSIRTPQTATSGPANAIARNRTK